MTIPWGLVLKGAALMAALGIGYGIVKAYNGAIERAQAAESDKAAAVAAVVERDAELASWVTREREWKEAQEQAAAALLAKTEEAAARERELAIKEEEYRHALKQLPQAERDCAAMPVPAAVDRLLGQ